MLESLNRNPIDCQLCCAFFNLEDDGEGSSNRRPKRQRCKLDGNVIPKPLNQDEESLEVAEDEQEIGDEEEDEVMEEDDSDDDENTTLNTSQASDVDIGEGGGDKAGDHATPGVDGSVSVTLTDPDVLDCPICIEHLSIPVFQCENGHIACSTCCLKVGNKCPSCSLPIGYNRCRAIEKVLESVKVSCQNMKYGCKERSSYSKKHEHEETCNYAPCSCPLPGCDFMDSCKNLIQHYRVKHRHSSVKFRFDRIFLVSMDIFQKNAILQEEVEGILFILNHKIEHLGSVVSVDCAAQSSFKKEFSYELTVRKGDSYVRLQSFIEKIPRRVENIAAKLFLVIPKDFFDSDRRLKLCLCISRLSNSQRQTQNCCLKVIE